jgi:hypothetical protein
MVIQDIDLITALDVTTIYHTRQNKNARSLGAKEESVIHILRFDIHYGY